MDFRKKREAKPQLVRSCRPHYSVCELKFSVYSFTIIDKFTNVEKRGLGR